MSDDPVSETPRRNFLTLLTASSITVGGVALTWPFLNSLNVQKTTVEHSYLDVDIASLQSGQQITVTWQGYPVFIFRRSPESITLLQDHMLRIRLRDPDSKENQQPAYATNWHRSLHPEIGVLVGVCTHLGCIPTLELKSKLGGYYNCACHGSRFDMAGRVFNGVPAPYNLPVPPYRMLKPNIIRIGENPAGEKFNFQTIRQV